MLTTNDKNDYIVSIIIACYNEIKHIEVFLDNVLNQELPLGCRYIQVLIADGMSEDGTRDKIESISSHNSRVCLIDNPEQIVSTGLNRAIRQSLGEIIVRMDVHTEYPPHYVKNCVETLRNTSASNVGGAARTKGYSYVQETVRLAYHSPFSVGGVRFHDEDYEGYVDTVTYGCWQKKTLEDVGLFDEDLVRNQDDELNLRITRSGGKIWQSRSIVSWYFPRSSISGVFRQYSQYGYWKVMVIKKHKIIPSVRHIVPSVLLASLITLVFFSPIHKCFAYFFVFLCCLYITANIAASLHCCLSWKTIKYLPLMPLVFAAYHFGYGHGFIIGIIDFLIFRKSSGRAKYCTTSRK